MLLFVPTSYAVLEAFIHKLLLVQMHVRASKNVRFFCLNKISFTMERAHCSSLASNRL